MLSMNLPKMSTIKPAYIKPCNDVSSYYDNLVKQNFNPEKPNLIWVSDITYVKVNGSFHYICVVIDLFSRKVISYSISPNMKAEFVLETLKKAYSSRKKPSNLIFHSDRGVQYTAEIFRKFLDDNNIVQSFSAKGYPYDNAVAESFFKFLKKEELNRNTYYSKKQLELSLFEYIESFYNSKRPHSANNDFPPNKFEELYFNKISTNF